MFFSSMLYMVIPGEFYMQEIKKVKRAEKRSLGHPAVLFFLSLLCYAGAGGVFGYCVWTYSGMETINDVMKIQPSLALEAEGYSCEMISSLGPDTEIYVIALFGTNSPWALSKSVGLGSVRTVQDQTMFTTKAACTDLFLAQDSLLWSSCQCSSGCSKVTCGGSAESNNVLIEFRPPDSPGVFFLDSTQFTNGDVAPLIAAIRADTTLMSLISSKGCSSFPFPPYACSKQTAEKTFTSLGVLSLSIANTELAYGILCLVCGGLLTGSLKKVAKAALKQQEDALEKGLVR